MKKITKKKKNTVTPLLGKSEKPVVRVVNAQSKSQLLIVCDHASNKIPKKLGNLGVRKKDLEKHVAWDPGTEDIDLYMAKQLKAPAVVAEYSRLVVDLNRGKKSPDIMREVYDHIVVPANKGLTPAQKKQRIDEFFTPYHEMIETRLKQILARKKVPVLISIHSFTPKMDGFKRPWHVGVLWNKDDRIARHVIQNMRALDKKHLGRRIVVGENEPYTLKDENLGENTISVHAEKRRIPYIIVEFRQDLVNTKAKAEKWAKFFLASLEPIFADRETYTYYRK